MQLLISCQFPVKPVWKLLAKFELSAIFEAITREITFNRIGNKKFELLKTKEPAMDFLKKEWKTILIFIWMVLISFFIFQIDSRIEQLKSAGDKLSATLGSVESVVITIDSGLSSTSAKMEDIDSNVNFIVQKVRRR